jgi:hypothetical protein
VDTGVNLQRSAVRLLPHGVDQLRTNWWNAIPHRVPLHGIRFRNPSPTTRRNIAALPEE